MVISSVTLMSDSNIALNKCTASQGVVILCLGILMKRFDVSDRPKMVSETKGYLETASSILRAWQH